MGFWAAIKRVFAGIFGRKNRVEALPTTTTPTPAKATVTRSPAKRSPATKAATVAELNPRCAAITAAGNQCKRSSRDTNKYCGTHKGYRARAT